MVGGFDVLFDVGGLMSVVCCRLFDVGGLISAVRCLWLLIRWCAGERKSAIYKTSTSPTGVGK
jgi:hypothetical protein